MRTGQRSLISAQYPVWLVLNSGGFNQRDAILNSSYSPVKSAERTMALFELFSARQCPLSVTEIANGMLIPQPSASVLVKTFVSLGYLDKIPGTRTYYPTLRIMLLGAWMHRSHEAAGQLPSLLRQIVQETGESVVLALRNGIYSQYVLAQSARTQKRMRVESGMLYPLACCATGWCLLSGMQDTEIGKIVRRTQVEVNVPLWRESAGNAPYMVQRVRREGYAMSHGQTAEGLGAIAVLLPRLAGPTLLSIAVGGPFNRIAEKKKMILDALREVANRGTLLTARPYAETRPTERPF